MAVIGIGTTSRASVEDVLAIVAAARAKMAEVEFGASPSPLSPLPRGERGRRAHGAEAALLPMRTPRSSLSPRGRGLG